MGGGAGCVCGVDAVDEAEEEEEGEPTAAAADVCNTTAVATGAEAATSSEAEAGAEATAAAAAATAFDEDDGDEPEGPAGSELWDDSLPGILGNEHTSQRVMSSWFWNVQRLQVHCSPAVTGCCCCWGSCGSAGADIERPPWYRLSAVAAAVAGSC